MPGIAGVIASSGEGRMGAWAARMTDCMMHESFYERGHYEYAPLGVSIGWADHSEGISRCSSLWNEKRDVCLIFSGEDFTDQVVIERLKVKGHEFDTTNASYLVHLYEEYGSEFFRQLNGWFCGVLVDLREEKVILFNDRYGLNRIYFHENQDGLFFASEAKSLLRILPELRRLDIRGVAEFCSCGCVLQNRTLFAGISLLPGASKWTVKKSRRFKKEVYFRKEEWENEPSLNASEYYDELKNTFSRRLPSYLRGNKKGLSLTGGLDGRMILAWAPSLPGELPCYTFGGSYRDCRDVVIARKVALTCRQSHEVIPVDGEFLSQFPAFAERAVYLSDGAMDVTGSVELYINRIAREIAPIRLTGNYGSEIVRGNIAFKPHQLNEALYQPEVLRLAENSAAVYAAAKADGNLSFVAFKQVPWHHGCRLSIERSQLTLRSPYLDNELVSLMYRAPKDLAVSPEPSLHLIADGTPALANIPTDRGLLYRPSPLLRKAKKLYQEVTFKAEYAYDYGMPQWLAQADHFLSRLHLERLFLGRHKFHHFRVWYRDRLRDYLTDVLLDPSVRNNAYFRPDSLEILVKAHLSGTRNYTSELHQALSLILIQRQLIEKSW